MAAKIKFGAGVATVCLCAAVIAASPQAMSSAKFDVVIRHGTVIDGTGLPMFKADVGITGNRIIAVGDLSGASARRDIDATGRYVTPGFVNIHDHPSPAGVVRAENMLTQGVTTEMFNPDGGVSAPEGTDPSDLGAQLAQMSAKGLAVNIGGQIGFNAIWEAVMGKSPHRATQPEIDRMRGLLDRALREGAYAVSAGLDYKPGYYATTEEVVAVVSAARKWRMTFPNHERLTPEQGFSSLAGSAETIRIGSEAGLFPEITHMKVQGHEQGKAGELLALMDRATAAGHYTPSDLYPYVAGQSGLGWLLVPGWAQEGGREAMLGRFRNPELRKKIVTETEAAMNARFGGPEGVFVVASKQPLTTVMRDRGVGAGEAVLQVLEKSDTTAVLTFGSEHDVVAFMKYPATAIACDCGARADAATHPRQTGTFPRVLGHYVRDQHVLSWEEAIRKMTGLPASTFGLADRGFLAPGMAADVTIFDPATITDHSTYDEPATFSTGVDYVLVNGTVALEHGKVTGAQGGEALRRSPSEPSRKMDRGARHVHGSFVATDVSGSGATAARYSVKFDLAQGSAGHLATGSLQITAGARALTLVRPGVLQIAPGWFSLTGMARTASGAIEPMTIIVDERSPLDAGSAVRLLVRSGSRTIEARSPASGVSIGSSSKS